MRDFLKDRRLVVVIGVAVALIVGLAVSLTAVRRDRPSGPPPASRGGLVVEIGRDDDKTLDPTRELRCFVNGQFAGMATLSDCAERNGVATGALDVGIDAAGELAAADDAGTVLTPLPPPQPVAAPAPVQPAASAACWRYADRNWTEVSNAPLSACVQTLFAGRCERPGSATYGRWGEQTLRLVPGKVEISPDNRIFRTLVEQAPNCQIPAL